MKIIPGIKLPEGHWEGGSIVECNSGLLFLVCVISGATYTLDLQPPYQVIKRIEPPTFRHEWTPEEPTQQKGPGPKSLTLNDLKRQVDAAIQLRLDKSAEWGIPISDELPSSPFPIGDFEVRRRKK